MRTIKAGAEDFLTKPVSSAKLLQTAGAGDCASQRDVSLEEHAGCRPPCVATLTPREREVFERVRSRQGLVAVGVVFELGTTERTIKAHRHRVMEKMQVQSLAELVSLAERVGAASLDRRPGHF